jgi:hypothetical protein
MERAWIRMTPVTTAAAYVVSVDLGFPEPSRLEGGDVMVSVAGGARSTVRAGRNVARHSFETAAPPSGTIVVTIEAPTWNRLGEPAEQGVRVDRVAVAPVRAAQPGMVGSPRP